MRGETRNAAGCSSQEATDVEPGEVQGVRPPVFGGQNTGGGPPVSLPRRREARPNLDQVELTEPHKAVLRLLRQRVMENTRLLLGLPRNDSAPTFARLDVNRAGLFVGRLLSDQNLLAARAQGALPPAAIRAALAEGMDHGVAETLQILYELEALDELSWRLVCDVIEEFQRKLDACVQELPDAGSAGE